MHRTSLDILWRSARSRRLRRRRYIPCFIHSAFSTVYRPSFNHGTNIIMSKWYRPAIPKVHCADTRHSAKVWVKVRVRVGVRFSLRVRLRASGNSRLLE